MLRRGAAPAPLSLCYTDVHHAVVMQVAVIPLPVQIPFEVLRHQVLDTRDVEGGLAATAMNQGRWAVVSLTACHLAPVLGDGGIDFVLQRCESKAGLKVVILPSECDG